MAYQTITLEKAEEIVTLTLNRPDRLNALSEQMTEELLNAFGEVDKDETVKVLVITGTGKAFCAGAEVEDAFLKWKEGRGDEKLTRMVSGKWTEKACLALKGLKIPTIAAINGAAVGWGCTFPLACDLRIASEEARMGLVFGKVGYMPEFGSTYLLPRVVGIAKACELIFTSNIINAKEAKEIGLVNRVVPAAELKAATYELAKTIAQQSPTTIQLAKRALYQGLDSTLASQLHLEQLATYTAIQTDDFAEGLRAFLEKRQPVFKGK